MQEDGMHWQFKKKFFFRELHWFDLNFFQQSPAENHAYRIRPDFNKDRNINNHSFNLSGF